MIKFEKVSFDQFKKDCIKLGYGENDLKYVYDNIIQIPQRSTIGSAGYDFILPFDISLMSNKVNTIIFPTGIRVIMPTNVVLKIYPRSGNGFKTGSKLANTVGIIDSDYYLSKNEGHIMVKLVSGFDDLYLKAGDHVVQGIFHNYLITDDDGLNHQFAIRDGGFGSTDKQEINRYAKGA